MIIDRSNKKRFFRTAPVALLAGCLWFSAGTAALAQDNSASPQASAQQASRTDADIQSDVGYALTHDATLQAQHIVCATADGTVILSGTVQTDAQRQQAEAIAANVPGVAGILNDIKVTNPGSTNSGSTNPPAQSADTAQSQVPPPPPDEDTAQQAPPPPPDMEPNQAPNQEPNQASPPQYNGVRPPYQPQQGGYYPPQPQQRGYYPPPQAYNPPPPSGPVTIPAGTLLRVRLSEPLDTARVKSGATFQATAAADVYQGGVLAIPRGAVLQGQVVESKKAGDLGGSAELRLQLTSMDLEGKVFPLDTDVWSSKGPNKAGYTVGNTVGIAALGAIIGGIAGGGTGAAIGAGVGGVTGLGVSSATSGPRLILPPEVQIDFHLASPVTVQPVSWQEAQRLASSVPQQPRLVQRPVYYAPRPYPYYPYPYPYYAYPYPYYYGRVY